MSQMTVVDKDAIAWFVNTAAFRMNDPTTGHNFDPGVKYRIHESEWMKGQPTIEATDMDEEVDDKVQKPKQPRGPRIDRNEQFVPSTPVPA